MDPEASISFVGEVCSRAAMVGEDVGVAVVGIAWRRGWWRFPSLAAPLTIGLGFRWGLRLTANLVLRAAGPHQSL